MTNDIISIAKKLNELYKIMHTILVKEVDRIIKNKITDVYQIEACLEQLLNVPTDEGYKLFIKLCIYYQDIDTKAARDYLEMYKELYFDEKPKDLKKLTNV